MNNLVCFLFLILLIHQLHQFLFRCSLVPLLWYDAESVAQLACVSFLTSHFQCAFHKHWHPFLLPEIRKWKGQDEQMSNVLQITDGITLREITKFKSED